MLRTLLAEQIDFGVGVDTHKDSYTAAIVTPVGGLVAHLKSAAEAAGHSQLLAFAREHARCRRIWAIEGTGSFGAGLTTALLEQDEWVVEIDHPKRSARRDGAKADELDALRAAREALAREHLTQPRRRGNRQALRVLLSTRESAMPGARSPPDTAKNRNSEAAPQEYVGQQVEIGAHEDPAIIRHAGAAIVRHVVMGPGEVALGSLASASRPPARGLRPRTTAEVAFIGLGAVAEHFLRNAAAAGTQRGGQGQERYPSACGRAVFSRGHDALSFD